MKKIIFILILFLSCFIVYKLTIDNKLSYLSIGDSLSKDNTYTYYIKEYLNNKNKLKSYNTTYTNNDYRITDILRIIKYNEEEEVNGKNLSIHKLLNEADIITLSLGMNELYYKLTISNDDIYYYIDEMMNDMSYLLKEINRYNHKQVFVLGYYTIDNNNKDIISYANIKLKEICIEEGYTYISLEDILDSDIYFIDKENGKLNRVGYEKIYKEIIKYIKNISLWYIFT